MERIPYDEFSFFQENALEYGLTYPGPPDVRREFVEVAPGRRLSALVWGAGEPEAFLIHGGSQNAHTWDTFAMALGRSLVAIDMAGHGHSDRPEGDSLVGAQTARGNAADLATALAILAPEAGAVVGMSAGGLATLALTEIAPDLVRRAVLVDVTPGVTREKAKMIGDFVNGPPSFTNFDELLERTVRFNPTRSVSSLRRGILHNAVQQDDGTWVWRWARWHGGDRGASAVPESPRRQPPDAPIYGELWECVSAIRVPLMLARGMRSESVVNDDDEAELLRRQPDAHIVHFEQAGHSIQGDMPVELAREIAAFLLG